MNTKALPQKASWWPKLIIAAFVFFALFIGNMVRQAMKSDVNLVSQDYYQKELAFQQHMEQVKATQALDSQVLLTHVQAAEQLSIVFPAGVKTAQVDGQILFFRPSDAKQDITLALNLNEDGQQHIRTATLAKGLWRVQLNWKQAGKAYYLQKDFTIE
ncbi:FixH family protein [Rufibacter hautae]|uniref:FixH family protein n=1 Tax=Rufibacter hautae TaxID=2595005 RepID=A0A5B6TDR6_9BACT|nr:FixH family protein [Rufibacter hautae]KAA3437129.1 FixH family protein [Rufibacter hautae]